MITINPVYGPVLNPYNNPHDVEGKAMVERGGHILHCIPPTDSWLGLAQHSIMH